MMAIVFEFLKLLIYFMNLTLLALILRRSGVKIIVVQNLFYLEVRIPSFSVVDGWPFGFQDRRHVAVCLLRNFISKSSFSLWNVREVHFATLKLAELTKLV